ncbi:SIS domain-containing protein [Infirmifilum sp. NZ]|uniref:SIS domain-containing protein n=1 Tax=Infirmifilum sp. NZ TaxID=2926850 RepID=UPI0027A83967|nr:SIS domain-containing protein [Infirmifilum sp. NZ]UNQ73215.1 SIS domain-containing protein [Infirmifilum sp. NZ]
MGESTFPIEEYTAKGAFHTIREIKQQPSLWIEIYKEILSKSHTILAFIEKALSGGNTHILLAGAGTSGYVGFISEGYLRRKLSLNVKAQESPDIVASPHDHIVHENPLLLVSHARSGDSPESLAVVKLVEKMAKQPFFLNITCNRNGRLARYGEGKENFLNIILPEKANDKGFAMTSSFTSMLLVDLLIPELKNPKDAEEKVRKISSEASRILSRDSNRIREIAEREFERAIFLGSGGLKGLAAEASLKMLELSRGIIASTYNSPLALRHGPKAFINKKSLVVAFLSNNYYTWRYEVDFLEELASDENKGTIVVFTPFKNRINEADYVFYLEEDFSDIEPEFLALPYAVYAQLLALYKSLSLGITPDNPYPEGRLSRVVREFKIYDIPQ